jgi:2-polyprenyl-6-methoxyphenol hydroxylase-like FAD-dependent oxidoreductase
MRAAVLGAGPAGCAAALLLARRGHQVFLVDRDADLEFDHASSDEIFTAWERPAVGQFRQPHNFLGRGRAILRDELPDVYRALVDRGAGEIHQQEFLGNAPREAGDEDLAVITCRRPVIDAVLREAVARQDGIDFRPATVHGLLVEHGAHVSGVELAASEALPADLVVDASGRNSPVNGWLREAGAASWPEHATDSKLLYYSRHYRFVGEPPPHASIVGGPRGDTGYLAYATFLGDTGTYCLCIMAPVWQREWRALRDVDAFERVARQLPGVASWLDAGVALTDVLPMGQLRNALRETVVDDAPIVTGVVPVGDARCHTNPTFAFGMSFSLMHAQALAHAADLATADADLVMRVEQAVGTDAAERFAGVSAEDADRIRIWSGEGVDPTDRTQTMPLFLRSVVYRVATQDPEILRAVCRRINLLDPIGALAHNTELLDRAEKLFAQLPPAAPPPAPAAMLTAMRG